jgi:hypothetical protein
VYESELYADALEKDADKFAEVMAKIFPKKDFEIEFSGV